MHWAAMHWAALNGHASTVVLLASMGADVNAPDAFQSRPLHYAADAGHPGYGIPLVRLVCLWHGNPSRPLALSLVSTFHKRLPCPHPRHSSPLPAPWRRRRRLTQHIWQGWCGSSWRLAPDPTPSMYLPLPLPLRSTVSYAASLHVYAASLHVSSATYTHTLRCTVASAINTATVSCPLCCIAHLLS